MEQLDKLIPLAILGAVGAFLVFLVRRVARENEVVPGNEQLVAPVEVKPEPVQIDLSIAAIVERPPIVVQDAMSLPVVAPVKRRRSKQPKPMTVNVTPVETPIQTVLGLLKEKDGLAAAFMLCEIFAPPVSKRG